MRIFISWAKEPSLAVAEALRDWLPEVIQNLEPWISSVDIGAGGRWKVRMAEALTAKFGILCVTPDNQTEPWLLFEAGALARTVEETFVCPYLINMRTSDLLQGPLTDFQAKVADRKGTFELLSTINAAMGPNALTPERLRRQFDRSWPDLEPKLKAVPVPRQPVRRSQDEVLAEILDTVRGLARGVLAASPPSHRRLAKDERRVIERAIASQFGVSGEQARVLRGELHRKTDYQLLELLHLGHLAPEAFAAATGIAFLERPQRPARTPVSESEFRQPFPPPPPHIPPPVRPPQ